MQALKQLISIKNGGLFAIKTFPSSYILATHGYSSAQPNPQGAGQSGPVEKGKIARKIPAFLKLEEGKTYSWCTCGLSKKKHLCDGSHGKDPNNKLRPLKFTVDKSKTYLICCCKQTNNRPYCDLTHVKTFIPEGIRNSLNIKL